MADEYDRSAFARRLVELRAHTGLSQAALGAEMGISQQGVGKWESGRSEPSIEKIDKLARLFSITADELLGRVDLPEMYSQPIPGVEGARAISAGALDTDTVRRLAKVARGELKTGAQLRVTPGQLEELIRRVVTEAVQADGAADGTREPQAQEA
ncbi:MAG: helix-turn-helix domain-containing protein [Oscillospiraceae bacterium]|jgi:transcriptional regulator with XRE-family HTH domain|nr:helix-turn-helix domain-containing protein [Oscillospiraceae bacterium]